MKERIAKDLLSIGAVFLRPNEPFTWASGIKSPIYCDNRMTLSYPEVRNDIEESLVDLIKKQYPETEILVGTATAGIAHAAIISHLMKLPMAYCRSYPKDHGRENLIEGKISKGMKAVVVEDLISTGGSVVEVVNTLRDYGAEVLGIASIFTYNMEKSYTRLKDAGIVNYSLTDFDTIIEVGIKQQYINEKDRNKLLAFRSNPSDDSWGKL